MKKAIAAALTVFALTTGVTLAQGGLFKTV